MRETNKIRRTANHSYSINIVTENTIIEIFHRALYTVSQKKYSHAQFFGDIFMKTSDNISINASLRTNNL